MHVEPLNPMKKELIQSLNGLLKKVNLQVVAADGKVSLEEEKPVEMIAKGKLEGDIEISSPSDTFEVGSEVFITTPEGELVPAPDGEHVIDGTLKITVSGGKIEETEQVETEAPELSSEVQAVVSALADRIADIESKLSTSSAELSAVTGKLKEAEEKLSKAEARVKTLEKTPGAASVKKETLAAAKAESATPAKSWYAMSKAERILNPELNPKLTK